MKRAGPAIVIIFALLALACGFGASTAALYVTQPSSSSSATVRFVVNKGDSAAAVAQNLQKAGLIRNAQLFRLWARYRHKDSGIEPGIYDLNASMTMDQLLAALQQGKPDELLAGVHDGLRVTQYPAFFTDLHNFNSDSFLKMVKSGVEPDGTKLWEKYWYVQQPGKDVAFALEGYLFPDSFYYQSDANETAVVERMIEQLGVLLCPGPDDKPTAYINDKAQCVAHGANISTDQAHPLNIFTSMENAYFTKDPVQALHDTLNVAGLTIREIRDYNDALGVATVYHNRLLGYLQKVDTDTYGYMGSDPSAQYARDTDSQPKDGHWWKELADSGQKVDPTSAYNTESGNHAGLPPSAIANAPWKVIVAAANPKALKDFPYFYFVSDKCGKIVYFKDYPDFQANSDKAMNSGNCK